MHFPLKYLYEAAAKRFGKKKILKAEVKILDINHKNKKS